MWYNNFFGPFDPCDCLEGKGSQKQRTLYRNSIELQNQMVQWTNATMELYKWEGLPETCNARMLEMSFLLRGWGGIFEIGDQFYTLMTMPGSNLTIYGDHVKCWGTGMNGFNREFTVYIPGSDEGKVIKELTNDPGTRYDCVIGRDNKYGYPYMRYILNSCFRMQNLKRAIDVCVESMKLPAIITAEESQISSIKKTLQSRQDNDAAIVLSVGNNVADSIKVFDLKVNPGTLKEFEEAYQFECNELKKTLGLNANESVDKKERLLVDEIASTNEETEINSDIRLTARREFCENVNKAFGLNVSVSRTIERKEDYTDEDLRADDDGESADAPDNAS